MHLDWEISSVKFDSNRIPATPIETKKINLKAESEDFKYVVELI